MRSEIPLRCSDHLKQTKLAVAPVPEAAALSASITTNCPPRAKVVEDGCSQVLPVASHQGDPSDCTRTSDSVEMGGDGGRGAFLEGGENDAESLRGTSF